VSLKLNKKNRTIAIMIIAVLVIAIFASSTFTSTTPLGIVVPGWEIYNQIQAMNFDGVGVKSSANEFTSPRDISASLWKVDIDDPYAKVPTIMVQTSDIRHVDFTGQSIPLTEPAKERTVTRNNHTYYLDYHIYMFDVTIRTIADKKLLYTTGECSGWSHETSWTHIYDDGTDLYLIPPISVPEKQGEQFSGGVYVKFAISPWNGVPAVGGPVNSTIMGAWSGIMNSYVFTKEQGAVANQWGQLQDSSGGAHSFVRGGLDNGAQVPMFADDGTYGSQSNRVDWDNDVTPTTRPQSTVILYLPVQEAAGAYLTQNWVGGVTDLTPCDVYVKYTLRVDVLTTHDFALQVAENPPTLAPPTDYTPWTKSFWESIADWFAGLPNSWEFWLIIIIIALVFITVVNPGFWSMLLQRRQKT
jgi:hypothetical protein